MSHDLSAHARSLHDTDRYVASLNSATSGWTVAMGLHFLVATRDEVIAELRIDDRHRQPYGVVHGGVYAGIIETVASVGAATDAQERGCSAVGLENHTSFVRAVREGVLRATSVPLMRGRRTQIWEATVHDERGRVAARGTVRLLVLEPETRLAGQVVGVVESGELRRPDETEVRRPR